MTAATTEAVAPEPICAGAPILPPPHQSLPVGHRFLNVHGVWTCANCGATT